LLLLVPLGDAWDRKKLIVASATGAAAVLGLVALAPSLPFLIGGSYLLGFISITPQLILPYAASLARPEKRGQTVGLVMSGLLIGILVSRCASGFLGGWCGWRPVFWMGAAVTFLIALALLSLPHAPAREERHSYPQLLRSLLPLLWKEPVLRRHALIGALGFAGFSAFWTTLPFYLAGRPGHFGSQTVGLFSLVAIAGAVAAPISGRLSDRFSARAVNGASLMVMACGFLLMAAANQSLLWLVPAVFLMDAGVQANQISNQTRIYALAPHLRSRLTSVYMIVYFLGGACGSAIGSRAWATWQWTGVWMTGAAMAVLALGLLFGSTKKAMLSASPFRKLN
jgi:predicted MFS family arabinose efflux permease